MTEEPSLTQAFSLSGPWARATEQIATMVQTGTDVYGRELPEGPLSKVGAERLSREYIAANPRSDLGIIYGVTMVGITVAAQGGIAVRAPLDQGGWLVAPAIQHFIGVAPSAWRKSTALNVAVTPLKRALAAGEQDRRESIPTLVSRAREQAEQMLEEDTFLENEQFTKVWNEALCSSTLVKDVTQEALRNLTVHNGGHLGGMAGEADIFRSVSAYSADSGSLTFFLDLWDQSDIVTGRVSSGLLEINEASLCLAILFQTDVFAEVTSGSARGMGSGADSYLARGIFGRFWVVEASAAGGHLEQAEAYSDDNDVNHGEDDDGFISEIGDLSALGSATIDYELALTELVKDTNDYRMHKAARRAWKEASLKYGVDLQVPQPDAVPREMIKLDAGARLEWRRLQRMQLAVEYALSQCDEDAQMAWGPLVGRISQHVLREAMIASLGAGLREVTGEAIADAATRLLPWRWGMTTSALVKRQHERAEDTIAANSRMNPNGDDLTSHGRVKDFLLKMTALDPVTGAKGFTKSEISSKFRGTIYPKGARTGVAARVALTLDELAADLRSGVIKMAGAKDAVGHEIERYAVLDASDVPVSWQTPR